MTGKRAKYVVTVNGNIESYHRTKSDAKNIAKKLKKTTYPERHVVVKKLYAKRKRNLKGDEGW